MIKDEKICKTFLKLFLFEDLNKSITEILKLLKMNHSTFYNHFFSFDDFIDKSLEIFSVHFVYKRKMMSNDDIFKIIDEVNNLISEEINKYSKSINIDNFNKNLDFYSNYLKKFYFHLVLLNIISDDYSYNDIKINIKILLEEAYFSLILHLKNQDYNFFEYKLISI